MYIDEDKNRVYEKVRWQVKDGLPEIVVTDHFALWFHMLNHRGLLNNDGKDEILKGFNYTSVLHDGFMTEEGKKFMAMYYERIVELVGFTLESEYELIDKCYESFRRNRFYKL